MTDSTAERDRVEILDVSLLETEHPLVSEMLDVRRELGIILGWHYLLDLSWIARNFCDEKYRRVLDAGAGLGILQWWLAKKGIDVFSIDRSDRKAVSRPYRQFCQVRGQRTGDLLGTRDAGMRLVLRSLFDPFGRDRSTPGLRAGIQMVVRGEPQPIKDRGIVTLYQTSLTELKEIADESVDAIVSISALEHNSPEELTLAVRELMRTLKKGGVLYATLGAAKEKSWFHEPSQGWCYTTEELKRRFELAADATSNEGDYDERMDGLRRSEELKRHLDRRYFETEHTGLPWGKWDPLYQPVGVVKWKK